MSLVSRKDFSTLCGDDVKKINVWISRKKIILINKLIDTENIINKNFLKERQIYNSKNKTEVVPVVDTNQENVVITNQDKIITNQDKIITISKDDIKPTIVKKQKPIKKRVSKKSKTIDKIQVDDPTDSRIYGGTLLSASEEDQRYRSNKESETIYNLETRKKTAEVLKLEREAEKALLQLKKMNGDMLPTDFVRIMFVMFSNTVQSVFHSSLENIASLFCDELAGGDRESLSRINQSIDEALQVVFNDAKDISKKELKNAIKEYSVTRGKGERDN